MKIYEKPLFFFKNRVYRVYKGGKLLGKFLNDDSKDSFYPEEWIASAVKAIDIDSKDKKAGVSVIKDTNQYLDDLIKEFPKEILGDKKEIGILVKYLDSAIRLPVQAHPDKEFSKQYFNSEHGKEECWIVLDKRKNACVYFGFKEGVTKEKFSKAIEESKDNKDIMETLLVKHEVNPGDIILVPAKTVHAIGAGCLILEIQEPTDFTIQPEYHCGDIKLTHDDMYIGLDKKTALECFDFKPVNNVKIEAQCITNDKGMKIEKLIGKKHTDNFGINKITLTNGEFVLTKSAGIYIIIDGNGEITGKDYNKKLKKGDYFLLPHIARNKYKITGKITIIECFS